MSQLKIISWNPDILTNRQEELLNLLNQLKPQVLCLQETGLKTGVNLKIPGYSIFRTDRLTARGGGTAILVQEDIPATQCSIKTNTLEHTSVTIQISQTSITIASIYSATGSLTAADLRALLNRQEQTIIIGDLNARHKTFGSANSKNGNILCSQFSESAIVLIPPEPTHQHHCKKYEPAILDYAIINFTTATDLSVLSTFNHTSDHHPLLLRLPEVTYAPILKSPITIEIINYPAAAAELATIEPANYIPHSLIEEDAIEALHRLTSTVQATIANATTYMKLRPSKPRPQCRKLYDLKRHLNMQARRCREVPTTSNRKILRQAERNYRTALQAKIKENTIKRIEAMEENTQKFWKNYHRAVFTNKDTIPPLRHAGTWQTSNLEKATALAATYSSRMRPNPAPSQPPVHPPAPPAPKDPLPPFTLEELQAEIKNLKNNSAPGLDGVKNELLKNLPENWLLVTLAIVNQLFSESKFPTMWKLAKVSPIPKPNKDTSLPENHRPISLLSHLSKLYERLVALRLSREAERLSTLPDEQFGFRPGHSTTLQLLRVMDYLVNAANEGKKAIFTALDIEGAFDRVPPRDLPVKLAAIGFHPQLCFLIHNYLDGRKLRVAVADSLSSTFEIEAGVPQGGVLSPLLYALYTHDVPTTELSALYADDTAQVIARDTPQEAAQATTAALQKTSNWAKSTRTNINEAKTQLLYINPAGGRRPNFNVTLNQVHIQPAASLNYLGVTFDPQLNFNAHAKKTISKAQNRFFALKRYLSCRSNSRQTWERLYPAVIQPMLLYGMEALSTIGQEALRLLEQDGPALPPNLRFTNSLAPSPIYAPTSSGHI